MSDYGGPPEVIMDDPVSRIEMFLLAFAGPLMDRQAIQGFNVRSQRFDLWEEDYTVRLLVVIDNGGEANTQLLVDYVFFDPDDDIFSAATRLAYALKVSEPEAAARLIQAGLFPDVEG